MEPLTLPPTQARPVLVWVISIFCFLKVLLSLLLLGATQLMLSGAVPLNDMQRHRLESHTAMGDHLISVLVLLLRLVGAILLFRLSRQALYCFVNIFAIAGLHSVYQTAFENSLADLGNGMRFSVIVFGSALNLAIVAYVWHLYATKILK